MYYLLDRIRCPFRRSSRYTNTRQLRRIRSTRYFWSIQGCIRYWWNCKDRRTFSRWFSKRLFHIRRWWWQNTKNCIHIWRTRFPSKWYQFTSSTISSRRNRWSTTCQTWTFDRLRRNQIQIASWIYRRRRTLTNLFVLYIIIIMYNTIFS